MFNFLYYDLQLYGRRRGLILCGIHIMSPLLLGDTYRFVWVKVIVLLLYLNMSQDIIRVGVPTFESLPCKAVYVRLIQLALPLIYFFMTRAKLLSMHIKFVAAYQMRAAENQFHYVFLVWDAH